MQKFKHDFGTARRFHPSLSVAFEHDAVTALLLSTLLELEKEQGKTFRVTFPDLCERLGLTGRALTRARDVLVAAKLIVAKGMGREGVAVTVQHTALVAWWSEKKIPGAKRRERADHVRKVVDERERSVVIEAVPNVVDDGAQLGAVEKTQLCLAPTRSNVIGGSWVGTEVVPGPDESNRPQSPGPSGTGSPEQTSPRSAARVRGGGDTHETVAVQSTAQAEHADETAAWNSRRAKKRAQGIAIRDARRAEWALEGRTTKDGTPLVDIVPAAALEKAKAKAAKAGKNAKYAVAADGWMRRKGGEERAAPWVFGKHDRPPNQWPAADFEELMRALTGMRVLIQELADGAHYTVADCTFVRELLSSGIPASHLFRAIAGARKDNYWGHVSRKSSVTFRIAFGDQFSNFLNLSNSSSANHSKSEKSAAIALYNSTRLEFEDKCFSWDVRKVSKIASPSTKDHEELLADVAKMRALIDDATNQNPEALVASAKEVR